MLSNIVTLSYVESFKMCDLDKLEVVDLKLTFR